MQESRKDVQNMDVQEMPRYIHIYRLLNTSNPCVCQNGPHCDFGPSPRDILNVMCFIKYEDRAIQVDLHGRAYDRIKKVAVWTED